MGPVVLDKFVKFCGPSLNRSPRNSTRSRRRRYFRQFFRYNFRPEVDDNVLSGVAVDNVGMDVPVKCGDSRSNGFCDIRGADFVSNERTRRRLSQNVKVVL